MATSAAVAAIARASQSARRVQSRPTVPCVWPAVKLNMCTLALQHTVAAATATVTTTSR